MDNTEFHNIVLQFEFSTFNHWWYEEFKNKLLDTKDWALGHAELLQKTENYNVNDNTSN